MAMMDDMKDNMGDTGGMKDRFEELKNKAQSGELSDSERDEYTRLRDRFENK